MPESDVVVEYQLENLLHHPLRKRVIRLAINKRFIVDIIEGVAVIIKVEMGSWRVEFRLKVLPDEQRGGKEHDGRKQQRQDYPHFQLLNSGTN